mgnify:CR=1 FL=1
MVFDVFERLDQIAHLLPPERWMLVGGLMVHAHARLAGIPHARPTDDADLVVEVRAGSYSEAARALQELGYQQHEPLDEALRQRGRSMVLARCSGRITG